MNGSIKLILLFALLILGITKVNDAWKGSSEKLNTSQMTISDAAESVHASFTTNDSGINHLQYPNYGESEDESAFDISKAILIQSNLISGLNVPKILKNNSVIRSMRIAESGLLPEYISDDPDNFAASPTYRYYIYGLRHIII